MIPGLGRSPGEGKGCPLQCSGLEKSMDCMYSPWGRKELDTTELLSFSLSLGVSSQGFLNLDAIDNFYFNAIKLYMDIFIHK